MRPKTGAESRRAPSDASVGVAVIDAVYAGLGAAGVFAAASTGTSAAAAPLVAGVGLGSATWMALLASGVALACRAVGPRVMVVADVLAGVGLLGFAGVLGYRTATDA